jgi:hypothetical protein
LFYCLIPKIKFLNHNFVISDVNRHVWIRKFTNTLRENVRDAADCRPEQTQPLEAGPPHLDDQ